MTGFLDCVVAVSTVHFQLTCVQLMAERDRLLRPVTDVDDRGMDRGEQTSRQISAHQQRSTNQAENELVDPIWEKKVLH